MQGTMPHAIIAGYKIITDWNLPEQVTEDTNTGTKKVKSSYEINHNCFFRDLDWIQTNDPQLRRLLLYSTELPGPVVAANVIFN